MPRVQSTGDPELLQTHLADRGWWSAAFLEIQSGWATLGILVGLAG